MPRCPECQSELGAAESAQGICAQCGHSWAATGAKVADAAVAGPRAGMRSIVSRVPDDPSKTQDPRLDLTLDSAELAELTSAANRDTDRPDATLPAAHLTREDDDRMTRTWSSAHTQAASPGMTIKSSPTDTVESSAIRESRLVIKPRTLREGHVGPEIPQTAIGADYELLEVIGKGGMGVVYAARQASIDRDVAVKMLRHEAAADVDQHQKFLAEAVVTGELDHPNIVPIYDLGTNDAGALFYSMKRVQGTPWSKLIGEKSLAENLDVLMKVCDALAFAHARGVVHRDLKPENVMIGEFGEVLVMDWGLALSTEEFQRRGSITQSTAMGGTPAYMAPEMAVGPIDRVGKHSDVYLLGAILYEIVTGKPPHTGATVMKCLHAVARNEIQPTDKMGELVDVARRAMATDPAHRHASVQAFQAAVRQYQAHAESILLASRAEAELAEAQQTGEYQAFSRALFGFEEALTLWQGNERARAALAEAKLVYARHALDKGDLDLAASALDADDAGHAPLLTEVAEAKHEREARLQRLRRVRRTVQGLVAAIAVIVAVAFVAVLSQRNKAVAARRIADENAQEAKRQEGIAKVEKENAVAQEQEARRQETLAKDNEQAARVAEQEAKTAKQAAEDAERAEEKLRIQREYEAYIAQIGLAAAKIDENAFGYAAQLLDGCKPELRAWEWGRLMHLCRQSLAEYEDAGPIDCVAFSPDGQRFATGSWEGAVRIREVQTGNTLATLPHGRYVHAVAFSPDGRLLATGSNLAEGEVKLWDAETYAEVATLDGHVDSVVGVEFSHDGRKLATASMDKTVRIWDVPSGVEERTLAGHTWWVWAAHFSPDDKQIVTASQDGTAVVWNLETGERSPPFLGHRTPVYAAAFSPDGAQVVTGGYDKRALVWSVDSLADLDYESIVAGAEWGEGAFAELADHAADVRTVAFSPDGRRILTGSQDNSLKLWNSQTGQLLQTLRGHAGWVRSAVFSPDGKIVLSGSYDRRAKLWNVDNYEETRDLRGHGDAVLDAEFSRDGQFVVTAARDRVARLWNAQTGELLRDLDEGHDFLVTTVAFAPDGKTVYTGGGDSTVRAWNRLSGAELRRFDRTGRSGVLALSPDGRTLLTAGGRRPDPERPDQELKFAKLWNTDTGELIRELGPHRTDVTCVAFTRDGQHAITGDAGGKLRIWDVTAPAEPIVLEGHSRQITSMAMSPDEQTLYTASEDNTVGQWDIATGVERRNSAMKHPDVVTSVAPLGIDALVATACEDGHLRIWNGANASIVATVDLGSPATCVAAAPRAGIISVATKDNAVRSWRFDARGKLIENRPDGAAAATPALTVAGSPGLVWSIAMSADGSQVLTGGGDAARLWSLADASELASFTPHAAVSSASFSPDGARVVTASWDGVAKIWDSATGRTVLRLDGGHKGPINSAVYSPDGAAVLTAGDDGAAVLWDSNTGKVLRQFDRDAGGHELRVRAAAFSPDGARIVTASDDKSAMIWDTAAGRPLRRLTGHEWAVLSAAFSPDGSRLITGGEDNTARIWSLDGDAEPIVLEGHTASIGAVAFSPDGRRVLTGGQDNLAKLWDAATGAEILNLKKHAQEVTSVSFSTDGRWALTASRDGTAVIWLSIEKP